MSKSIENGSYIQNCKYISVLHALGAHLPEKIPKKKLATPIAITVEEVLTMIWCHPRLGQIWVNSHSSARQLRYGMTSRPPPQKKQVADIF